MSVNTSAHPEELLSLSKQRLEGAQACFETDAFDAACGVAQDRLRQAKALLSMSGLANRKML
jgi:hypothetical protein